jgi:hypothetical protein
VNARHAAPAALILVSATLLNIPVSLNGQGANPSSGPPPAAKSVAPFDLTGYWVSIVTEDWRYRMVTPAKGDYQGLSMLNPEAMKVAAAWDPIADEKAGQQCRSYGAAAIMRVPGRLHITWLDDNTLRIEFDAGMQSREFRFDPSAPKSAERSWQGDSVARWEAPRGRGRPGGPSLPAFDSLKVVTTNLKAGYLRKNGVPYSENAVVTDYFDMSSLGNAVPMLVVTTVVEDPQYLTIPFIVSTQFKKQSDAKGWDPTPCSATW